MNARGFTIESREGGVTILVRRQVGGHAGGARHPNEEQVMTKVFIGGSRRVTRLNADVQRRIDKIIEQGFSILVGDANGADKAVQTYLRSRRYHKVDVFCTAGNCRNNVGDWPIRTAPAPAGSRGFDYYAVKDDRMAEEASVGPACYGVARAWCCTSFPTRGLLP
jgi:hypothetical protein